MADEVRHNWDHGLESVMKLVLHKKGVRKRQAAEVGRKVVNICRGKDIMTYLTSPGTHKVMKNHCKEALGRVCQSVEPGKTNLTQEEAISLANHLVKGGFMARAVAKVMQIDPTKEKDVQDPRSPSVKAVKDPREEPKEGEAPAEPEKKRKKWPEKVSRIAAHQQQFEPVDYYIITYEGSKTFLYILSAIAIIIVLACTMFSAWPMWAKVGVWYCVFWLSFSFLMLVALRMLVYILLWCGGLDFWIFPNLLDEYAGILDSFVPFYSMEWRRDGFMMIIIRIMSFGVIGVAYYEFQQHVTLQDIADFASLSITDILEWGKDKLAAPPDAQKRYPSIEDVKKATEDAHIEEPPNFSTKNVPEDFPLPEEPVEGVEIPHREEVVYEDLPHMDVNFNDDDEHVEL